MLWYTGNPFVLRVGIDSCMMCCAGVCCRERSGLLDLGVLWVWGKGAADLPHQNPEVSHDFTTGQRRR